MNIPPPLKIIFAGTPVFAAIALQALIDSPHQIIAVYTQPDRPAGRGRKLTASPVKELALQHALNVYQPTRLYEADEHRMIRELQPDIIVVAAYGLMLPVEILQIPRLGCINIHASLLPHWRGAAPIQRAILAGDEKTGVTIMQMEQGLDTGPMLYKIECPIQPTDTSATLHTRLAQIGADALLATLHQLPSLKPQIQNESMATYAHKITKEEAKLDWHTSAAELLRKIRAFNPWPVAFTQRGEQVIRIWEANIITKDVSNYKPGEILQANANGIDIATSQNSLRLLKIQLSGGRVLPIVDILNAQQDNFTVGTLL
ncbi:MAG: fmt [Gammaproteobacteria bacterium]|nr:fmt [Gammaproteobacteria bacterium]